MTLGVAYGCESRPNLRGINNGLSRQTVADRAIAVRLVDRETDHLPSSELFRGAAPQATQAGGEKRRTKGDSNETKDGLQADAVKIPAKLPGHARHLHYARTALTKICQRDQSPTRKAALCLELNGFAQLCVLDTGFRSLRDQIGYLASVVQKLFHPQSSRLGIVVIGVGRAGLVDETCFAEK